MQDPARLREHIDYTFVEPHHLEDALTHRSAGGRNNERLEFLGDAALNFIIADELYQRFPEADEGTLSRLRARLVRGDTLAELAVGLELGSYVRLGPGELKSGGFRRKSILADALEAIIGAVYLDGGLRPCRALVLSLLADRLASVSPHGELKDAKTRLQEMMQAQRMPLPEYIVLSVEGDAHAQVFKVECRVAGLDQATTGSGTSRRRAEQQAAAKAVELLTRG